MNCPKCGSSATLQFKCPSADGHAAYVCECGHQWNGNRLTILEQIEQSQTPEEFAEIFVFPGFGGLWHCYFWGGAWCDKKNATAAVLGYFKRKLGVEG